MSNHAKQWVDYDDDKQEESMKVHEEEEKHERAIWRKLRNAGLWNADEDPETPHYCDVDINIARTK